MKTIRTLALILGALATVVAPCAPALAYAPACRMPGCEKPDVPEMGPASSCCCDSGNSAAEAAGQSTAVTLLKADPLSPSLPLEAPDDRSVSIEPVSRHAVPASEFLYILHAALLI